MTGKALIVSPYLDHLGGGERYMLSVAQVIESMGYSVYFAWDNLAEIEKLGEMLGITLKSPMLSPAVKDMYFAHNPSKMFFATREYDVVVYLSDGSLPMLGGRRNIVHMQVPFHDVGGISLKNQIKKRFIDEVIVNSKFTKHVVDKEFGIRSRVIYPPVATPNVKLEKKKIILSVGRFEPSLNAKKQDILLQAFQSVHTRLPGWTLVLAGASSSDDWVQQLKTRAGELPVRFEVNVPYGKLTSLYAEASIYWHAAGYGLDENKNPELVEHFGITTVEAISMGCVPLVVPYGGQKEIITDPALHWEKVEELAEKTIAVAADPDRSRLLHGSDVDRYSEKNFAKSIREIVD